MWPLSHVPVPSSWPRLRASLGHELMHPALPIGRTAPGRGGAFPPLLLPAGGRLLLHLHRAAGPLRPGGRGPQRGRCQTPQAASVCPCGLHLPRVQHPSVLPARHSRCTQGTAPPTCHREAMCLALRVECPWPCGGVAVGDPPGPQAQPTTGGTAGGGAAGEAAWRTADPGAPRPALEGQLPQPAIVHP